jgi:hypothetical protein
MHAAFLRCKISYSSGKRGDIFGREFGLFRNWKVLKRAFFRAVFLYCFQSFPFHFLSLPQKVEQKSIGQFNSASGG